MEHLLGLFNLIIINIEAVKSSTKKNLSLLEENNFSAEVCLTEYVVKENLGFLIK